MGRLHPQVRLGRHGVAELRHALLQTQPLRRPRTPAACGAATRPGGCALRSLGSQTLGQASGEQSLHSSLQRTHQMSKSTSCSGNTRQESRPPQLCPRAGKVLDVVLPLAARLAV